MDIFYLRSVIAVVNLDCQPDWIKKQLRNPDIVVHPFTLGTWEAEAGRYLLVQDWLGLHSDFHGNQHYIVRPSLEGKVKIRKGKKGKKKVS